MGKPKNKIFLFLSVLILGMFMLSFVSSADFDNIKPYDEKTQTYEIINWFGVGETLANIKLLTPLNVQVPRGYQKIAEIGLYNFKPDYKNAFEKVEAYNVKDYEQKILDKKLPRTFDYKYKDYITELKPIYETICTKIDEKELELKSNETETCITKITGYKNVTKEVWIKFDDVNNLPKDRSVFIIGLFTTVEKGDNVEWIPTFFGEELDKWATWTESLSVDLANYYKMDDTTGNLIDELEALDLTQTGTISSQTGIINNARGAYSGTDRFSSTSTPDYDDTTDFSDNFWIYRTAHTSTESRIFTRTGAVGELFYSLRLETDDTLKFFFGESGSGTGQLTLNPSTIIKLNTWTMVTITHKSDGTTKLYINGTVVSSGTETATPSPSNVISVGSNKDGSTPAVNLYFDEYGVWERELTTSEISDLYNSGDGLPYIVGTAPSVTLTSPVDTANLTSSSVTFQATVTDDQYVENVTLYLDGIANETKTTHVNGSYSFTKTVTEGVHNWSILAYDNQSLSNQSETWTFNYTQPPIYINLISPDDVSTHNTPTVNMSCNASKDGGILQLNLTINGAVNQTITNTSVAQNLSISQLINFSEGNYTWGCSAYNADANATSSNRTFEVLYSNPVIINLSPTNNSNYTIESICINTTVTDVNGVANVTLFLDGARYYNTSGVNGSYSFCENFTDGKHEYYFSAYSVLSKYSLSETNYFNVDNSSPSIEINFPSGIYADFGKVNSSVNLTWNVTDINLDSCWYNYNGTNVSINCSLNQTNFTLIDNSNDGNFTLTFYANDTYGHENSSVSYWWYKVFEGDAVYTSPVLEGSEQSLSINLSLITGLYVTNASIVYNNVIYTGTGIYNDGSEFTLKDDSFLTPDVSVSTNRSFFFMVSLDDGTEINTTSRTQTVNPVNVDNCSNYTYKVMTIFLEDETHLTELFGDIDLNMQLKNKDTGAGFTIFYGEYENVSNLSICAETNLSASGLYLDAEIKYSGDNYAPELYYIKDSNMLNYPINLTLYDLISNSSTEFLVLYQDETLTKVPGANVQLLRKYIGLNEYKVVELPLTSDAGNFLLHIDLDNVIYKAIVTKGGTILDTFDNVVFSCENELSGQCSQTLVGDIDSQNVNSITSINDFSYSISSANNTIETTFTIPSGTPSSVNIYMNQLDVFGNSTMCNKTILSSGGSVSCSYNDTIGDSYIYLTISKNGKLQAEKSYNVVESGSFDFLGNNFFIVFVLVLSLVGMAFSSPEFIIINGVVALLFSGSVWLLSGTSFVVGLGTLAWLIIAAIILISKVSKQEDKNG